MKIDRYNNEMETRAKQQIKLYIKGNFDYKKGPQKKLKITVLKSDDQNKYFIYSGYEIWRVINLV